MNPWLWVSTWGTFPITWWASEASEDDVEAPRRMREDQHMLERDIPQPCMPQLVYWEVTKRCNLRCAHCRALPTHEADSAELSLMEGKELLDKIAAFCSPIVVLTGGEPLIRPDVLELATYGTHKGLRMALATNGTLVTRDMARRIVAAGFRRVSISLDGAEPATHDGFRRVPGAFDMAVDGFIHLKELGMSMQVNTTVTQHNVEQLDEVRELVLKLRADAWHLFLLVPVGCGLEITGSHQLTPRDYERVLHWLYDQRKTVGIELKATCAPHYMRVKAQRDALERAQGEAEPTESGYPGMSLGLPPARQGCLAGTGICFISHRGEVFPCGYLPVKAGDVRTAPFKEIWNRAPVFAELRDLDRLLPKCGICEYRAVCGGCRARAYGQTGDYLAEEPFCNYQPVGPA